jgi:hypothetical protein
MGTTASKDQMENSFSVILQKLQLARILLPLLLLRSGGA